MRKKSILAIVAMIGLSSFVVLGSSPSLFSKILESVQNNPITQMFSPERQSSMRNGKTVLEMEAFPQERTKTAIEAKNIDSVTDVPDEIVYFVLFHHLVGLKKEAEKAAAKGESLDYFKLYEDQAELKDSQSQLLFQTAQDCMDAVTLIDKEAKEIIDIARAKVANGQAESKNNIPEAPVELTELQRRKDETVLRYRDALKNGLGAEKFSEFNSFAQRKIGPQITTNLIRKEEK